MSEKLDTQNGNYVIKENNLYGIIAKDGIQITPCIYEKIDYHADSNMYRIMLNGKIGMLDSYGKTLIPPVYSGLSHMIGNLHIFICFIAERPKNPIHGIIFSGWDLSTSKDIMNDGSLFINPKYSLLDQYGKEIFHPHYDWISPFCGSLAVAKLGEYIGLINSVGQEVVPIIYDSLLRNSRILFTEQPYIDTRENCEFKFLLGNTVYVINNEGTIKESHQYLDIPRFDAPYGPDADSLKSFVDYMSAQGVNCRTCAARRFEIRTIKQCQPRTDIKL